MFEAKGFFLSQGQKGEPGDLPYVSSLQEEPVQVLPEVLMMVVINEVTVSGGGATRTTRTCGG